MVKKVLSSLFGTKNDRLIKTYQKRVKAINALEASYEAMNDDELKSAFNTLKERSNSEDLDLLLNDAFAITREAAKRTLSMRHYDVQLIGGIVLHEGKIAEMKTGEGKTLVATLAVALNAMKGRGVHIVTVNDYLARRDGEEMTPLYSFLGYDVGILTGDIDPESERIKQYEADITYGTNNEYGFDYLRDNMKQSLVDVMQKDHHFVIVDEVDSILIDEARTPLIISGPVNKQMDHYKSANDVATALEKETHFTVDEKDRVVLLTEEGINKAEELFGIENMYDMNNAILAHHLEQALKAHYLFTNEVDYVVKNDEVIIVDEFTGRLSEGRRYSEGLHQALEAKEQVLIKEESQTLADITFQNFFRLYDKLAGMTGTAQTEAAEFAQIYTLDVLSIPTNVPVKRVDNNDYIYKTAEEKFEAVIDRISELNKSGQPVLVGTISIEQSEFLSGLLKKSKIAHTVLNAKQHEREAEIIINAGQKGAVTIATNMAGRGVDIKITDEVRDLGGLYIIGTERHESRRIDNQLRGRSGRQGDAGGTQFFLSLEDNLLRIFGSERISKIMDKLGVERGEFIDSKMVTRAVENAQKKVEEMHFESRKNLLEYDDVSNAQRKVIYTHRREVLNPEFDMSAKIISNLEEAIDNMMSEANIIAGLPEEDYDTTRLINTIKEQLNLDITGATYLEEEAEPMAEKLKDDLSTAIKEKFSILNDELRGNIERQLYLNTLDETWREHLYQMDLMKTGIRLRSYNQKDPLVEFKKESYQLFTGLVERIKLDSTSVFFKVQFRTDAIEEEEKAFKAFQEAQAREAEADLTLTRNPEDLQKEKTEKKVSRNEPCPCGSGKKYKHCHGQSGPKKGLLAE
jgi:preprotein translocase subunit SecA